jgi:plastocyanin
MRLLQRITLMAGVLALCVTAAALWGCSKKDKTTNPPPSGGSELNSGDIVQNATWPHTFAAEGHFTYHCERHPGMIGSVHAQSGSGPMTLDVTISGSAFSPQNAVIRVGGTVSWTNLDGAAHTVTSP